MSACNGCGASIDFVATPAGKKMPVDARRTPMVVEARGPLKFVTDEGEIVSARLATDQEAADRGAPDRVREVLFLRAPHWPSCPARDRFKAKGRTAP